MKTLFEKYTFFVMLGLSLVITSIALYVFVHVEFWFTTAQNQKDSLAVGSVIFESDFFVIGGAVLYFLTYLAFLILKLRTYFTLSLLHILLWCLALNVNLLFETGSLYYLIQVACLLTFVVNVQQSLKRYRAEKSL
ncbi:MAG: hypothetical protein WBG71_05550 [Leeuwenhoekiella sp.]